MAIIENTPLDLKARLAAAGITLYVKNGKTVLRPATSRQPERRTRAQFVTRQRIAHNNHLWRLLRSAGDPRFEGGSSPYHRFCSLMTSCTVPFLTRDQHLLGASLLLPGMVVSDGPLEEIGYSLGTADGAPALVTDLDPRAPRGERYRLYSLRQEDQQGIPRLSIAAREFAFKDLSAAPDASGLRLLAAGGGVALAGSVFADPMCGFALVRLRGGEASSQRVVTGCDLYRRFATDEALLAAAATYGGLTR